MKIPYGRAVFGNNGHGQSVAVVKQSNAFIFFTIVFNIGRFFSAIFTIVFLLLTLFVNPGLWVLFLRGASAYVTFRVLTNVVYFFRKRPIPEFFIYEGDAMGLNKEVLDALTYRDVAHLSRAEQDFFRYYKESEMLGHHSSFCEGPRPSQEEQCNMMLAMAERIREIENPPID